MKFPQFDKVTNPRNEKRYIAKTLTGISTPQSFEEICLVAKSDPSLIIDWVIPKGLLVIETKELEILKVIKKLNLALMVVKRKDTLYIFGKSSFGRLTELNILACGITANTYAYNKKGVRVTLPFKTTINTASIFSDITIEHSNGIGEIPTWLLPLKKISGEVDEGISLPIKSNAKTLLVNQLNKLKSFSLQDQEEILTLINEEFNDFPLSNAEMKSIIEISEEMILQQFFDGDTFLHNKLGDYIIDVCNIKRDTISKELFYYNTKKQIYCNDESYIMGYMTKLCPQLKDYQKQETVKYILNYLYDDTVEFNTNPYVIVFRNGVLDLTTMLFEPMTPAHLESIQIGCDYDPDAYSKTVDEFFDTATNGNKDIEVLLYEAMGYAMLKTNALQKAFILLGSGRNGKSTYLDLCKAILGKGNYASISFKDLANNFRASTLINKLGSFAGDISSQPIQDSDLFKSITAGEEVTLEQKYKEAQTKELFCTMFYACNKLPATPDTSEGFYRRWCIIPFIADLTKVSAVDGMTFRSNLLSDESRNYAAYKAVQAIKNVLDHTLQFTEPMEVKEILKNYKIDGSTILSWFKEMFNFDSTKLVGKRTTEMYLNYVGWCDNCGRKKSSRTTFVNQVKDAIGVELLP